MVYAGRLTSSESLSAISAERNPVPPEISFTAWFSPKLGRGGWRVKVTCILDTGAGESYWLSGTHPWSATRKSVPSEVVLPDGSRVAVGHELRGFLRLQEEKSVVPVSFNVLAGSQGTSSRKQDPRRVLVGRQLIQTLGVKVLMPSAWLNYEEKKTTLGDLLVAQVYEDEEVSWSALPKGLEPLVPPSTDSSDVVLRVTEVEAKEIESILQGLPTGWTPVPRCPGFFFRYRRLLPVEIIDIPQQWMATELRFPDDVKHTRVGSYSATLFNKLSVTQKETFRRLVQEYLDKKWWVEVKDPCLYEGNPLTANVFMLGGGESKRKARLVCDFRSANGALSKVSSEVPDISATFALLTILSPKVLLVGDFTAAFYHVRLWGVRVCLIAAFARYLSNRLTFGLSIGPGGLGASLNPPLDEFRSVFLSEVIRLFVDDYLIAGYSPEDAVRDLAYWISGLSALGQHTPLRKFYAAAGEKLRKILEDEFKKRGLLYTPVAQGRYLGVRFCFSREETGERLSFSCERSERSQKARAAIKQIIEEGVFTRRELFRLAGQIGFDPLGRHGVLRALADCLRSVAGSAGSTWDDRVSLRSASYQAVYPLLIWVDDIYANEPGDCVHLVAPGPPGAGVIRLRAASDSSLLGAGYVVNYLYGSEEILLREHCWRWKAAEGSWHSNRRELAALHKCLQAVADIVNGCKEYAKKNNLHFDIVLLTDNKPSSQWLSRSTFGGVSRSRALERRALDRLLNACAEECHDIRHQVPGTSIRVEHVEGSQNEHPDRLSRIFYRQCGTIDGGKVVIGDLLNTTEVVDEEAVVMGDTSCVEKTFVVHDPVQWVQEGVNSPASAVMVTDTVCSLTSVCAQRDEGTGYGLAERWAADSYDVDSILRKVRLMKTILRRWLGAARRAPRQEASSVTEYDVEGDVKIIARSAQACLNNKARERLLRGGSPMVEEDGILYFQLGSATGKPFKQIYIPVECRCLRKTILHDGHRRCGHGGREATLATVDMFYFPSCGKELRALLYKCIPCRLNRAKLQRRSPPSMSKDEESLLLNEQPYWSVDVDVLHLGGYVKLLVVVCRATGHCTLVKLTKEDGPSVLKCLQKVQLQRGGLRYIYTDQASYFSSEQFAQDLVSTLGGSIQLLASSAPWEAGRSNRIHGLALTLLRKVLRRYRGRIPADDGDLQLLLEYLMYVLNSRPLGRVVEIGGAQRPLTPDMLAFGYDRRVGPMKLAAGSDVCVPLRDALAFRREYLRLYWRKLRTHVLQTMAKSVHDIRPWTPYVGETVMVIRQRARKADLGATIAHVDAMLPGKRVMVVFPSGRKQVESFTNLCPLEDDDEAIRSRYTVQGPSRVGCRISVQIADTTGSRKFYQGTIRQDESISKKDGRHCLVTWDDGSSPEWLDLDEEVWRYEEDLPKPSRVPRRRNQK